MTAYTSGGIQSEDTITSPSPSKAAQVRHKGVNPFTDGVIFIKPDLFILSNLLDAIDVVHCNVIIAVRLLSRFTYALQLVPSRHEM